VPVAGEKEMGKKRKSNGALPAVYPEDQQAEHTLEEYRSPLIGAVSTQPALAKRAVVSNLKHNAGILAIGLDINPVYLYDHDERAFLL